MPSRGFYGTQKVVKVLKQAGGSYQLPGRIILLEKLRGSVGELAATGGDSRKAVVRAGKNTVDKLERILSLKLGVLFH